MKRFPILFVILLVALTSALNVFSQVGGPPIAYWKLDELPGAVFASDVGGSFPGLLSTNGSTFGPGISGNALKLTRANNGFVDMGDVLQLTNGNFSIVSWVRLNAGDQTETVVVHKHNPGTANGYFIGINKTLGRLLNDKALFSVGTNNPVTTANTAISQTSVNDGNWHQIVTTYDRNGVNRIYVDEGAFEDQATSQPFIGNAASFFIGGARLTPAATPTGFLDGFVDEVQIYDRALTQDEVEFLFRNPGLDASAFASPGNLDHNFDPAAGFAHIGANPVVIRKIIPQSNGRLLIAGSFATYQGVSTPNFARINPDGSIDTSFFHGFGGSADVLDFAVQSDQKIVVVGAFDAFHEINLPRIARITADGFPDPSFRPGKGADHNVHAVAVHSDGSIVIGGTFTTYDTNNRAGIARLLSNGKLDTTFDPGSGFVGYVNDVAVLASGQILAAGKFTQYNGVNHNGLVRINSDGTLDSTFNAPFEASAEVKEIMVRPNGQVVAVGSFTLTGGNGRRNAARLNTDGTLDGTFGSSSLGFGPNGAVNAIELCSDGFIVAGDFTTYDGVVRNRIAKLTTNGLLDDPGFFNTQLQSFTEIVSVTNTFSIISTNFPPDTNILFGYVTNFQFITVATNTAPGFTQTNFVDVTTTVGTVNIATAPNTNANYFGLGVGINGSVQEIALTANQLPYIGGSFTSVYGITRLGLAKLQPCPGSTVPGVRINGLLIDATTGGPISGATITTVNEIANSSSLGRFSLLNAVPGANQVVVTANGFFSQTNVVVTSNQLTDVQFTLSPGITDANTVRFVLTWGAEPRDLDSHLIVPPPIGQTISVGVDFINRGSLFSDPFAFLDVDGVSGFGPETITITRVNQGIYNYFIRRFSGAANTGFTNSQAKIQIYTINGLIGTINAPTTGVGEYWHVLQLNGTNRTFGVVNSLSNSIPTISTNVVYNQSVGNIGGNATGLPGPPRIDTQPQDSYSIADTAAAVSVGASGTSPLGFQWYYNNLLMSGATSSSLTFPSLANTQSGEYFVVVTNILGVVTSRVARVTAISSTSPFVFLQPTDVVVDIGGMANFEAIGGGTRPLFYNWRHNGNTLAAARAPILTVTNVQPADTGTYQMQLANSFGTVFTKQVNLLVATPPVITNFSVTPGNIVLAGQEVTLKVEAEGKSPFEYIWYFDGNHLPTELASSLVLSRAHITNSGVYTVVVTNALGSATNAPFTLTVNSPPIITTEPQNLFQTVGLSNSLSVTAIGTAPLTYQWRRAGTNVSGETSSQLIFTSIQESDVGLYTVVISNGLGVVTSRMARVDVVMERALLPWVQNLGGSFADVGEAVAVDAAGNSYVVGSFAGTAQFGSNMLTSAGLDDIFIVRLDINGNVVWAKRFGGSGYDAANDIASDTNGNLFVTGSFRGIVDFGGTSLTNNDAFYDDLFIARYDNAGSLVWVRGEGEGFFDDAGYTVAIDSATNVYVGGSSTIGTFGGTTLTNDGRILLAKYDSAGSRGWARKAGASGSALDEATGVAVDSAGNIFLTATFQSSTITSAGTVLTNRGFSDGFAAKFNASGDQLWIRQVGSLGVDRVLGVATVGTNAVIVGQFSGTNDFGGNTLVSDGGTLGDGFVVNIDGAGNVIWARRLGGSGSDAVLDVATDGAGAIYVTGFFQGTATFGDKTSISIGSTTDIFAARLRQDGSFEFVQQVGGDDIGGELGRGIAVDSIGNGVFTGSFRGTLVAGGNLQTSSGGDNVFVSRLVSPPMLSIEVSGNQFIFSWPVFWPGFDFEMNDSGLSATNWVTNSALVPVIVGDRYKIINTISTNIQFFRLRRP